MTPKRIEVITMANLEFSFFYDIVKRGINHEINIDETIFFFDDDPEEEHGYIMLFSGDSEYYCDGRCCDRGFLIKNVDEVFNAKVWRGKSLKERWEHTVIDRIGGKKIRAWLSEWTDWPRDKVAQIYEPCDDTEYIKARAIERGRLNIREILILVNREASSHVDLKERKEIEKILELYEND